MNEPETVVVADLTSWEAMVHLGAALRREGYRVVRVTGAEMGRAQRARIALERLVFAETLPCLHVDAKGEPDVTPLLSMLAGAVDVQMVDAIGAVLSQRAEWSAQPRLRRVHAAGLDDQMVYDKWLYSQVAEQAEVTIPATFTIPDAPGGRPLVVKGRIGSGGDRVRIVASSFEIDGVLADWELGADQAMVQEVVAGDLWNVGGVAHQGEVLVAAAYRAIASHNDPEGPPVDIKIEPKPDQIDATAAFIQALGYSGPFAIDFLDDGVPYLLDFNPRFFGTWAAMQSAGVDLLGAYLRTIGGTRGPQIVQAIDSSVVPASLTGQDSIVDSLERTAVLSRRLKPIIGVRGATVVALEGLAQARKARGKRRPAVALAYVEPWLAALQWGAALRREGVEVIRHTTAPITTPQRVRQSMESLCFDRTLHTLASEGDEVWLDEPSRLLEGVLDLQMTERVLRAVVRAQSWADRVESRHVPVATNEVLLFDKQAFLDWAAGLGLAVPRHWEPGVDPDVWPVICKPVTGYGGVGVRQCESPAQMADVLQDLAMVVQEFLPGRQVNVGGVARSGEVIVACAYEPVSASNQRHGPPVAMRTLDDPQALNIASSVIGSLGYTGPFCLDLVADAESRLRIIDFNARVFGSWTGLQRAGVDILGAYLHCLDLADAPAMRTPAPGKVFGVDLDHAKPLRRSLPLLLSGMAPLVGLKGLVGQAAQLAAGRAHS